MERIVDMMLHEIEASWKWMYIPLLIHFGSKYLTLKFKSSTMSAKVSAHTVWVYNPPGKSVRADLSII